MWIVRAPQTYASRSALGRTMLRKTMKRHRFYTKQARAWMPLKVYTAALDGSGRAPYQSLVNPDEDEANRAELRHGHLAQPAYSSFASGTLALPALIDEHSLHRPNHNAMDQTKPLP